MNREDIVHQVKAVARGCKTINRAASAGDALHLFRQMQTGSGVTSCAVFQKGVLVNQSELEQAARREQNLNVTLGCPASASHVESCDNEHAVLNAISA